MFLDSQDLFRRGRAEDFRGRQQHPILAPVQQVLHRSASARETTGATTGNGVSTGGPLKLNGGGACNVLPKSSDSGGSGESDGRLEKTVSLSGEENKMDCLGRGAARWAWTENTATNTAAKGNTRFKYARLKPISNYQASGLDTLRQK